MKRLLAGIIVLVTLSWHFPSSASPGCFSPVPGVTSVDAYRFVPVPQTPLSEAERTQLETWFRYLEGIWQGQYSETHCRGTREQPEVQRHSFRLRAQGQHDPTHPSLVIKAQMDSSDLSKPVRFELYLDEENRALYYQADSSGNRVQVRQVDDRQLVFVRKHVVRTVSGGVLRREAYVTLTRGQRALHIEQNHYINGQLSDFNRWQLR